MPVDEITRKDIQQFVDNLTVGPGAKVSTLRLLRSVLEIAREDGRIHTNPARGCSAGRIPARDRHHYLTATEVVALSAACGDHLQQSDLTADQHRPHPPRPGRTKNRG